MNTKIKQIVEKLYAHRCELAIALMALVTLALLMLSCHAEGATLAFALVATGTGGEMVTGGPVTTDAVHEAGTDYLLNEIDRQITKIRPMATPVDQLSRLAGAKRCGSMVVDYYNVDTKPTKCTLKKAVTLPSLSAGRMVASPSAGYSIRVSVSVEYRTGISVSGSFTSMAV